MIKRLFSTIFANIKQLVSARKDILLFPLLGAITYFFQQVMDTSFDIKWISDFNVWATAFLVSSFLFMAFDLTLENIPFFKKYDKITTIISFFVSTFIGESVTYSFQSNIPWWRWVIVAMMSVLFFACLLFILGIGATLGKEKAKEKLAKEVEKYRKDISEMTKEEKETFVRLSKESLKLDKSLLHFIQMFDSEDQIIEMMHDVENS